MTGLRSNYSDLFLEDALPVLDAVIMEQYERQPDKTPLIFRQYTSDTWGDQTTTMAGVGPAESKAEGEGVAFDRPLQGYDKTFKFVTYAVATSFSEELIEDNRLSLVEDTYRSLGTAMHQTKMITCFNIFNNGFSDTGPDGENLFDTGHPLIGGGTYGNRPTTDIALSVAGIRSMETQLMRQVNDRNINIVVVPMNLLVPPELQYIARELTKSEYKPQTSNNEINTIKDDNLNVIVAPWLTSATAWFATASPEMTQLRFYNRVDPTTRTWFDEKTGTVNTRIRCRFDVGYSDYKGTWGTTG